VDALPAAKELRSLRSLAYLVQAWRTLAQDNSEGLESLGEVARSAANRLVECYARSKRSNWFWFESRLTYANAVLPHALFDAAAVWNDGDYLEVAEASFGFLDLVTTADDLFWPIGNREWFSQGEEKSLYDQQPVEASTMAAAAVAAWSVTSKEEYLRIFDRSHRWFMGDNSLGLRLADTQYGTCCDGLMANGLNKNQGAESTLAFLWTEVLRESLSSSPAKNLNPTPPAHQAVTL